MTSTNSSGGEPGEIQAQIAQLREQVDALMNEHETRTVGCAMCAGCKICAAARGARQHAEKLASNVREQPLLALLIAGTTGFVLGRVLR